MSNNKKVIVVDITQEIIDKFGDKADDPTLCPTSKAVRLQLTRKLRVATSSDEITIGDNTYDLPKKVVTFQQRLIEGKSVKPISFRLSL